MHRTRSKSVDGFTLVEIVLALGVFAFAIIGVVFLLGTALQSSTDTQRDSALTAAISTTSNCLRTYDKATRLPKIVYFDQKGSKVFTILFDDPDVPPPASVNAYYRIEVTKISVSAGLANQQMYSLKVLAPYPAKIAVGNFLASQFTNEPPRFSQ